MIQSSFLWKSGHPVVLRVQQYKIYTVNTTVMLLVFICATGFSLCLDHHSGPLQLSYLT
jgi:hypothetical protein